MRKSQWYQLKRALKVGLALLLIPIVAWVTEYTYTHYLFPRSLPLKEPPLFTEQLPHTYDYNLPFTLIRKLRRLQRARTSNVYLFIRSVDYHAQVERLSEAFEKERKQFDTYYYTMVERYRTTKMPLKLMRRLHYYRDVLRTQIGQIKEMKALFPDIIEK